MSDLSDVLRQQTELARAAQALQAERDPAKLLEAAAQLQQRAQQLQRAAEAVQAAHLVEGRGGPDTVVVLTEAQRQRIAEQTGVGMSTVTLHDTAQRVWAREMPRVEPREIEKLAAQQAAVSRLARERRDGLERIAAELEKLGQPELAETVAQLRAEAGRSSGE